MIGFKRQDGDFDPGPVPAGFIPEFSSRIDPITQNELRMAIWFDPERNARSGLGYTLSTPDDNRAGRLKQAERDIVLREAVWAVAVAARALDTDPKARALLERWKISEVDGVEYV